MSMARLALRLANRIGYDVTPYQAPIHNPLSLLGVLVREQVARDDRFFFVQIGANDGKRHDDLRPLVVEYQLSGILVEPLPDVFVALQRNYTGCPGLVFENCAVDDSDGTRVIYRIRPGSPVPDYMYGMASFNRRHLAAVRHHVEPLSVRTQSLETLFSRHHVDHVSLFVVDTEGHDAHILRALLATQVRPRIVKYEFANLGLADQTECIGRLEQEGYRLLTHGLDVYAILEL